MHICAGQIGLPEHSHRSIEKLLRSIDVLDGRDQALDELEVHHRDASRPQMLLNLGFEVLIDNATPVIAELGISLPRLQGLICRQVDWLQDGVADERT